MSFFDAAVLFVFRSRFNILSSLLMESPSLTLGDLIHSIPSNARSTSDCPTCPTTVAILSFLPNCDPPNRLLLQYDDTARIYALFCKHQCTDLLYLELREKDSCPIFFYRKIFLNFPVNEVFESRFK